MTVSSLGSRTFKFASETDQETGTETGKLVAPDQFGKHGSAPKAWCELNITSDTLGNSYNVSSATNVATGRTTVNWDTDFATTNYGCVGTQLVAGAGVIVFQSHAVGSVEAQNRNTSGTLTDISGSGIVAFGEQ